MRMFEVQGVEIQLDRDRVFEFVSDPRNLPRWAKAFRSADQERARLETPGGALDIGGDRFVVSRDSVNRRVHEAFTVGAVEERLASLTSASDSPKVPLTVVTLTTRLPIDQGEEFDADFSR